MTNLERYKDEFVYMLKKNKIILCSCFEVLNNHDDCDTCPYDVENCVEEGCCNYRKFIDWLLEEHKEPIKLKQWEYDLIRTNDRPHECNVFESFNTYRNMKAIGYFEGITDTSMTLKEILENCEVVE